MSQKFIGAAFDKVCESGEFAEHRFVSLYERRSYYGGPEEGGWHGEDVRLVKTQVFATAASAESAKKRIEVLAQELSEGSRREWSERMAAECDWCEARGLDADALPEPDGPSEYFVVVESEAGESESRGPRHYE